MGEYAGRVVLITGGASGLGLATARAFAADGAQVVIADRNGDGAHEAATTIQTQGGSARGELLDVTDATAVNALVERLKNAYGAIDALVHCAGISRGQHQMGTEAWLPMEELLASDWDAVIRVNLTGTFFVDQAVGRVMIDRGKGRIINVGSMSGVIANAGVQGLGPYNASKGGVIALTKALAAEWAPYNITVNCISPGYMATEMGMRSQRFPEFKRIQIEWTPLRRLGTPEEFAHAALYLASDGAAFVTGHNLVIDGGYTSW
ncbi:MAG TPA: SDR family NAD(P)-dependent oxidoreductase [Spirochaetia bacterium]|nr:SDR family NAD(P)-dependent oxidoreductase [Spirochaetia bacterium]